MTAAAAVPPWLVALARHGPGTFMVHLTVTDGTAERAGQVTDRRIPGLNRNVRIPRALGRASS
jgi:hypothetical protein